MNTIKESEIFMTSVIKVTNLSIKYPLSVDELYNLFSIFGYIIYIYIDIDDTNIQAYIQYISTKQAEAAIVRGKKLILYGRVVYISPTSFLSIHMINDTIKDDIAKVPIKMINTSQGIVPLQIYKDFTKSSSKLKFQTERYIKDPILNALTTVVFLSNVPNNSKDIQLLCSYILSRPNLCYFTDNSLYIDDNIIYSNINSKLNNILPIRNIDGTYTISPSSIYVNLLKTPCMANVILPSKELACALIIKIQNYKFKNKYIRAAFSDKNIPWKAPISLDNTLTTTNFNTINSKINLSPYNSPCLESFNNDFISDIDPVRQERTTACLQQSDRDINSTIDNNIPLNTYIRGTCIPPMCGFNTIHSRTI